MVLSVTAAKDSFNYNSCYRHFYLHVPELADGFIFTGSLLKNPELQTVLSILQ